jgi:hypothetical protein
MKGDDTCILLYFRVFHCYSLGFQVFLVPWPSFFAGSIFLSSDFHCVPSSKFEKYDFALGIKFFVVMVQRFSQDCLDPRKL